MKQGDVVMIYEDPITKQQPEGKARLREKLAHNSNREYWVVRFVGDGSVVGRWIKKEVKTQ